MSLLWLSVMAIDVGQAQTNPTSFPASAKNRILADCIGAGDQRGEDLYYVTSVCVCMLHAIESVLTLPEYEEIERYGPPARETPQSARLQKERQRCFQTGLAATSVPPASSAEMGSYSMPIPAGFFAPETMGDFMQVEGERGRGGLILVERRRAERENALRGRIVVLPAESTIPTDEGACKAYAERAPGGITQSVSMVQGKSGPRCEIKKADPEPSTRGTTFAFFSSPRNVLVVLCIYDIRDSVAIEACNVALEGLRFRE